ncbi:peptidase [Staphylococcus succinus]|uniref:Peptidase n=2 Tax=Staphylococcus succinus TaxID=61015 RepID=A0A9Q6HP64_9STAP|nr:PepSY domain-containing protein [Staphylococcus succinus]MEB8126419.1 PepSY domain-containing protein [Staphylococcus succinus]MEB8209538.1 PepSY domain-containing protein [Staphylococcus succinus]PTI75690.1 peptidase [Staphylococcus succinus]PTJ13699.1 peptidase [Staphylococcus succinus]RIN23630.1 peptidase [Staphylococcus succinus]
MTIKRLTTLTLSAVLLTACGNSSSDSDKKSASSSSEESNEKVITLNDIQTSPKAALKKAQSVYSGQNLKGISYEQHKGEWVYKIEQQKSNEESEVIVSDKDKALINKETEKENSVDSKEEFKYSDAINFKDAIKKGQKEVDGDIKEWSLSKDNGKLVYDMDLKKGNTKYEVSVDAKNGELLNSEKDN